MDLYFGTCFDGTCLNTKQTNLFRDANFNYKLKSKSVRKYGDNLLVHVVLKGVFYTGKGIFIEEDEEEKYTKTTVSLQKVMFLT